MFRRDDVSALSRAYVAECVAVAPRRHGLATPIGDVLVPLLAAAGDGPG
jgi:hypothetical protein